MIQQKTVSRPRAEQTGNRVKPVRAQHTVPVEATGHEEQRKYVPNIRQIKQEIQTQSRNTKSVCDTNKEQASQVFPRNKMLHKLWMSYKSSHSGELNENIREMNPRLSTEEKWSIKMCAGRKRLLSFSSLSETRTLSFNLKTQAPYPSHLEPSSLHGSTQTVLPLLERAASSFYLKLKFFFKSNFTTVWHYLNLGFYISGGVGQFSMF